MDLVNNAKNKQGYIFSAMITNKLADAELLNPQNLIFADTNPF